MSDAEPRLKLPDNAYRELEPGESYTPVIPGEKGVLEVTLRSVAIGFGMAVLFSAAAAYIALKLGQGIESAIPISILAIGLSAVLAGARPCSRTSTSSPSARPRGSWSAARSSRCRRSSSSGSRTAHRSSRSSSCPFSAPPSACSF
jgi:hypothetical protein